MTTNGRILGLKWNSTDGHEIIQSILRAYTSWSTGLRPHQLDVVSEALDGTNFLYIDATGSGKSCVFSITIVVLKQYNKYPGVFLRGFRTREHPVGLVITPTKGLGHDQVCDGICLILNHLLTGL
jgi:superfamily II DNA helicase RecQ